jgi:hypothetical protein
MFSFLIFLLRFWAFLGKGQLARGVQKHHKNMFTVYKKSMSKTFPEKIDKDFDFSFSSTFSVLSRFRVFLSDVS